MNNDLSGLEGYVEKVRKFGVTDNSRSNYWVTPERAVLALVEPLRRLDEWEKGLVIQGLWDQKDRIEELEGDLQMTRNAYAQLETLVETYEVKVAERKKRIEGLEAALRRAEPYLDSHPESAIHKTIRALLDTEVKP